VISAIHAAAACRENPFHSISPPGRVSCFRIAMLSTLMKRRSCGSGARFRSKTLAIRLLPNFDSLLVLAV
jgi:hypothetical protein